VTSPLFVEAISLIVLLLTNRVIKITFKKALL
jgi:hypothetical protein